MITPMKYPGSKIKLSHQIIDLLPPDHKCYVEVFGGSGAVLFAKQPSTIEVYNDLNNDIATMFRMLRDKPAELFDKLKNTPYSRTTYIEAGKMIAEKTYKDELEHAWAYFVMQNQSYSGRGGAASWSFSPTERDILDGFLKRCDNMERFASRLRNVFIESADFRDILKNYDDPKTVFYLDPPYVTATRTKVIYAKEFSDLQHIDMIDLCLSLKGACIVSGYESPLYKKLETKFRRLDIETQMSMNHESKRRARTEVIWYSPNCAYQLEMTLL